MELFIQIINTVGFPCAACIAMYYFIRNQIQAYREDIKDLQKEHKEEISKMSEALKNNTEALQNNNLIIQRLCDRIDKEDK